MTQTTEWIECDACDGEGCVDSETGAPSTWEAVAATECAQCNSVGRVLNIEYVPVLRDALTVFLESEWIAEELENANYHSVRDFIEALQQELRELS